MAKFKKSECGNPAGRPKGAQSKEKIDLRMWINKFTEENSAQVEKDFKDLKPAERCMLYVKLLEYVLPKKREDVVVISEREKFLKKFFGRDEQEE